MSDSLYPTRFWWNHHRGIAKCDGVLVELKKLPSLVSLRNAVEVDYAPNIVALVKFDCEVSRDLTTDEVFDILGLLHKMAHDARQSL